MSRMELNKGTLMPVHATVEQLAESNVSDDNWQKYYDNRVEYFENNAEDYGFCKIGGTWYKVDWEIRSGDMENGFANVDVNNDGSIDFHTQHYNGGGHWTEVVEGALKENNRGHRRHPS